MKTMTVNLKTFTVDAPSKNTLLSKLNNQIKYGIQTFVSCDVGGPRVKHDDNYVYGITIHKTKIKRARKDFVLKNKLMTKRELNSYCKFNSLDDCQNPMITYSPTKWVATVTQIPKAVLRMNNQKIQQNKDSWKII